MWFLVTKKLAVFEAERWSNIFIELHKRRPLQPRAAAVVFKGFPSNVIWFTASCLI